MWTQWNGVILFRGGGLLRGGGVGHRSFMTVERFRGWGSMISKNRFINYGRPISNGRCMHIAGPVMIKSHSKFMPITISINQYTHFYNYYTKQVWTMIKLSLLLLVYNFTKSVDHLGQFQKLKIKMAELFAGLEHVKITGTGLKM